MITKSTLFKTISIVMMAFAFTNNIYSQDLLEMNLEDLLNISVTTASKSAEKQTDAPGVISVLTQEDLRRFGGTTLKDVLERVPGLAGSAVYMTDRSMIAPRGDQIQASSGHVLLLINGRPVRESLEGGIKGEVLNTFPLNAIESIEVIKGPGSVLYGTTAFSAVINIKTKKAEDTGFSVSGLVGDGGAYGTQADLTVKSGDFSLFAAGRYFEKAEWDTDYEVYQQDGSLYSFGVKMPDKGPGAFLDASFKNLRVMAAYNNWTNYFIIPDYIPAFSSYGDAEWEKVFGNIGYDFNVSDNWSTSVNVTYTNSWFEVTNFPAVKRDSYDLVAEVTNFITLSDKSKLVIGGLWNKVDGGETFYGAPPAVIPISNANRAGYGLYAQIDYKLLDNLKGIGGIQLNKYEEIDLGVVPRFGFIWYPVERVNVKALYSQAFRAPSINEFNLKHPNLLGDPSLNSEKVGTFDLSISYQGEQTQSTLNFFYSNMTDIIYQNRTVAPAMYANGVEAKVMGFEFEGKFYVTKDLYVVGSVLYHDTKDSDDNENITPIASLGTKVGVSYDIDDIATLSLFDLYQGDLDEFFTNTPNVQPGAYNRLNLYGNVNLNKLFKMNLQQDLSLFVQVDNVLDEEIWLPAWGLTPGQSLPYVSGRAMYAGLKFSL